jgi:hypothetical protein
MDGVSVSESFASGQRAAQDLAADERLSALDVSVG